MPSTLERSEERAVERRTVVGWQGIRCVLPPEWNVTGFSMDRENGSLRIDAPGNSTLTILIRWMKAGNTPQGPPNLYTLLAPRFRKMLKKPEPVPPKPDLKANIDRLFKEAAKQAKKSKAKFESSMKPEKTEGEQDERTAINFSWTGDGRGQGKIWYCATCRRVVIAQVVGMAKDQSAIASLAAQLFSTLQDHAPDGFDRWALYDLQADLPEDFRLEAQKLLSGYLSLTFARGAERVIIERWGLANMALKKFTLDEWFHNNAQVRLKRMARREMTSSEGHEAVHYNGSLPLLGRLKALREAKLSLRRFPSRYEGGAWECEETNKLFAVQVWHNKRTSGLWREIVQRCVCHE